MYQFSGKLKTFSIALIILGALGVAYSFYTAPTTVEQAKDIIAHQSEHGDAHGSSHGDVQNDDHKSDAKEDSHVQADHGTTHENEAHASTDTHAEHHDAAHDEHVFHQLQNRPWSAFYVALFFFLGITLLVLAFYAIQRVAQAGWSIVLFRVMEAITANLVPTSIFMLLIIVAAVLHMNHMFPWMAEGVFTPGHENYDPIVDGKSWWMNLPGCLCRYSWRGCLYRNSRHSQKAWYEPR
jgi:hypothetical protein